MPGGRAADRSEAQPISCHIDDALVGFLLPREGEFVVSKTQFGILEVVVAADVLERVILLLLELPLVPAPFCTELFGTVTNWAVAKLPSDVLT